MLINQYYNRFYQQVNQSVLNNLKRNCYRCTCIRCAFQGDLRVQPLCRMLGNGKAQAVAALFPDGGFMQLLAVVLAVAPVQQQVVPAAMAVQMPAEQQVLVEHRYGDQATSYLLP